MLAMLPATAAWRTESQRACRAARSNRLTGSIGSFPRFLATRLRSQSCVGLASASLARKRHLDLVGGNEHPGAVATLETRNAASIRKDRAAPDHPEAVLI